MPEQITQADLTLLAFAREAKQKAYAPYSGFRVGAAVFAGGDIFVGVNVENAAFGSTICAERGAAMAAVAAGHTAFDAIAISGDSESPTVPCGACRQFLAEFNPEMRVILGGKGDAVEVVTLDALLPEAFVRGYLDEDEGDEE
ncbi:MAG: cytidine deaminase [Coriobacteriia bacterium]|nr:cytidine deaminase [Coriobacteriia bacterium]